jgi:ferredoxin
MATPEELHEAVVRIGRSNPQERQGSSKYLKLLDYSVLQKCIHCGICLPTCPTYDETKLERNSPRGRIALMRGIADGRLEVTRCSCSQSIRCTPSTCTRSAATFCMISDLQNIRPLDRPKEEFSGDRRQTYNRLQSRWPERPVAR